MLHPLQSPTILEILPSTGKGNVTLGRDDQSKAVDSLDCHCRVESDMVVKGSGRGAQNGRRYIGDVNESSGLIGSNLEEA